MFKWARRRYLANVFGLSNDCTGDCGQGRRCTCAPEPEKEMKALTDFERGYHQGKLDQMARPIECMCGLCKLGAKEWVNLTDEELSELSSSGLALWELWRAIEAKSKEKNQ